MRMATLLLPGLMFLGACATTQDLVNRVPMPGVLERESNEARIAAVLYDVEEGMERGRVFKVVSHISPRYRDQAGRDYEGIRQYVARLLRNYRDIRITRAGSRIAVDGDRATVIETFGTVAMPYNLDENVPINLQGQVTVRLAREDGVWKIIEWGSLQ